MQVKVSKPDGSPAVNESILVTARDHGNEIYLEKVFSTNHMGEIDYSICQGIMENTSTLSMFVSITLYYKAGRVTVFARASWRRYQHFLSLYHIVTDGKHFDNLCICD